jgi:hypothetical protein
MLMDDFKKKQMKKRREKSRKRIWETKRKIKAKKKED